MGRGIPRTPDDVTEHSQLTMQRFLEVLSSPDKQLVTSVMSGSQHTVHLLINNIRIYAASNLTKSKLINIYYNQIIQHNMGYICITDALLCKHVNCSNPDHVAAIDGFYHSISRSLIASSADTIRSRQYACRKRHKAVPGWNDTVKHAHGVARNSYIIWRNSGRPRHGPVSDDMRRSRLLFTYILKQCQRNEEQSKADAMAKSMRSHDMKSFWKDVSST